jgi:hypothetical protein
MWPKSAHNMGHGIGDHYPAAHGDKGANIALEAQIGQ